MSFQWTKDIGFPLNLPFKSSLKDKTLKVPDDYVSSTAVPLNEVWEVTHINCHHLIVADEEAIIDIVDKDGTVYRVKIDLATRQLEWSGHLWLDEGDYIRVTWETSDKGKNLTIFGVKHHSLESSLASQKLRIDLILPKEFDIQEPRVPDDPPM